MTLGRLHVLTDARAGRDALGLARGALAGGAPVIQLRVKDLPDRDLYELGLKLVAACAEHGAACIVNDRVDIALAIGAQGTHLGADDLPLDQVRRIAGPGHLIGGTARDPERAAELVRQGADYLGVGPAYATSTKDGLPDPVGPAGIGAVARAIGIPVIAIGGVTAERVPALVAQGVHGVAVVAAVSDAEDPARATAELLAALP